MHGGSLEIMLSVPLNKYFKYSKLFLKNNGVNALHGGLKGLDKVVWNTAVSSNSVVFSYLSKDGDEGYPGGRTGLGGSPKYFYVLQCLQFSHTKCKLTQYATKFVSFTKKNFRIHFVCTNI